MWIDCTRAGWATPWAAVLITSPRAISAGEPCLPLESSWLEALNAVALPNVLSYGSQRLDFTQFTRFKVSGSV